MKQKWKLKQNWLLQWCFWFLIRSPLRHLLPFLAAAIYLWCTHYCRLGMVGDQPGEHSDALPRTPATPAAELLQSLQKRIVNPLNENHSAAWRSEARQRKKEYDGHDIYLLTYWVGVPLVCYRTADRDQPNRNTTWDIFWNFFNKQKNGAIYSLYFLCIKSFEICSQLDLANIFKVFISLIFCHAGTLKKIL